MSQTHRIEVAGIIRDLPIREVAPNVFAAILDSLGDWELNEAVGRALAKLLPREVEALVMPEGKATALLHVIGRERKQPTIVARKAEKPYMDKPVVSVSVKSITTEQVQMLYLGADKAAELRGKKVAIVDDVVSTGGTLKAMNELLAKIGSTPVAVIAILTEGNERPDVIKLGHIPLF